MTERRIPIRRALFSAYDKTGIVALARSLTARGVEILATGATAAHLRDAGVAVRALEERTGFGDLFEGRVKTLTPLVHGGILMRRDRAGDREQAAAHGIEPIDLVCVNLYPFRETVARPGAEREACIEMIDIGGPAMIRAAAKNHRHVVVVPSPAHCGKVMAAVEDAGGGEAGEASVPEGLAARLAAEAFAMTAAYDAAVFRYLSGDALLDSWAAGGTRWIPLRYGENPSQPAACYLTGNAFWSALQVHQGKELSYNNLADLWAGWRALGEFSTCAAVVIKHRMPSGLALGETAAEAFTRARDGDALSAFGGVVVVNREADAALARELSAMFIEIAAAPAWSADALAILARKKNVRVLTLPASHAGTPRLDFYAAGDAALVQEALPPAADPATWTSATRARADGETLAELQFAWRVVRHVRSNAIALTRERRSIGLGGGQTSRIDACDVALMKARRAGHATSGAVLASDAYFPFPDVVERAAEAGVRAIVQPGGSRNDAASIAACDARGLPMIFTGERAFAH